MAVGATFVYFPSILSCFSFKGGAGRWQLLSLISNVGQHGGAEKWRIRRNMENSEKWAG